MLIDIKTVGQPSDVFVMLKKPFYFHCAPIRLFCILLQKFSITVYSDEIKMSIDGIIGIIKNRRKMQKFSIVRFSAM